MNDACHKPLITIKEARKILGSEYECISDDDLMVIIMTMQRLASDILDIDKVPKNVEV